MDELLTKGAMWVAYISYSTLSNLIAICTYLLFKTPTIRQVWTHIQHRDHAFSIDIKDAYLHIPIVKHYYHHHHHFYSLFGNTNLISGRFCILDCLLPLCFSLLPLNLYCSFAITRVCMSLFTLINTDPYLLQAYW